MSIPKELDPLLPTHIQVTPPESDTYYTMVTLTALGILLMLGAMTLLGLHLSHAAPHIFNTIEPLPLTLAPLVAGVLATCAGFYGAMRAKALPAMLAISTLAAKNLHVVMENHDLDPRRFQVTGTDVPIIHKIGMLLSLFQWIGITKESAADSLRDSLNQSVEILNDNVPPPILAAKYNRFVETSTHQDGYVLMGHNRRKWGKFVKSVKKNSDHLTQPIYKQGRWYHMEHQANHSPEATVIFCETQLKRLIRFLSLNTYCNYFSQNESADAIYQRDQPTSYAKVPTVQNIGHATLLFQMGEMNILTDPVFGDLNTLLYPRQTMPGLEIRKLPPIDVILISHNHRDHCNLESLKQLVPHQPQMLIPKGDFKLFKDLGFTNVHEHEWWMTTTIACKGDVVDFHSVPARHWSGRGMADVQTSLMCSWVFKRQKDRGAIYFRGDTAAIPEEIMREIRHFVEEPIMANFEPGGPNYSRRWMESTHQSVLDSMMSCFEVNPEPKECMTFLMHHNTFELGSDRFNEALIIQEQIFAFLKGELVFADLPEFVQKEWDNTIGKLIEGFGAKQFIRHMRGHFHSLKIGQKVKLVLN